MSDLSARDQRIVEEYTGDEHKTLTEVGEKYDLSAERVRQILEEHGVTDNHRSYSKEFCLKELIKYYEQHDELPSSHKEVDEMECSVSLAYDRLGGASRVIEIFDERYDSFDKIQERKKRSIKVDDEELLEALRDVCDKHNCSAKYYMENSPARYPHAGTISGRFGSWNRALTEAGIVEREPGEGRRENRKNIYTDTELISSVLDVCEGERLSAQEYEEKRPKDYPSYATLIRRLDKKWSELMDMVVGEEE